MLDLNHPMTKFTFAIAREDDRILSIAKRMTLVDTDAKTLLLPGAHEAAKKMTEICVSAWGNKRDKLDAIQLLHRQITEFAAIPSANCFVSDWQGKLCTVCGSEITSLPNYEDMIYCPKCLDYIDDGRRAVDQAFGLWCI